MPARELERRTITAKDYGLDGELATRPSLRWGEPTGGVSASVPRGRRVLRIPGKQTIIGLRLPGAARGPLFLEWPMRNLMLHNGQKELLKRDDDNTELRGHPVWSILFLAERSPLELLLL